MKKQVLSNLHFISSAFEDLGLYKEAAEVDNIFQKVAKKKKKSSGKNVPNNPSLWASCKAWAKRTFDVYPSAYANGAAAKRYKSKGGTWRKSSSQSNLRIANLSNPNNNNDSLSGSQEIKSAPRVPSINDTSSGYMEMDYQEVINILKNMITEGQITEADELMKAIKESNTELSEQQLDYLEGHYNRIKKSLAENLPYKPDEKMMQAYNNAQTIVSNILARLKVTDLSHFSNADERWEQVLSQVNKITDNRTRQIAFNILGRYTQDNWMRKS